MSKSDRTTLGDRMKQYEAVTDYKLYIRTPIIVRVDGRAFHTLTSFMDKPYDNRFTALMDNAAAHLMRDLSSARLAFVQSDEISVVLCPYTNYDTEAPFSARIQKITSVAASTATEAFIMGVMAKLLKLIDKNEMQWYLNCIQNSMTFDCRCFNLQQDEVLNYLIWRQRDSQRNAILSVGQYYLGQDGINGLKSPEIIEKLDKEGIDYAWAIPDWVRNGRCCFKGEDGKFLIESADFSDEKVKNNINKLISWEENNQCELPKGLVVE